MKREVFAMLLLLFDVETESVVFDAAQTHHQLIVRREGHQVPVLIFVQQGEGGVLQVTEGRGAFTAQILEAGADVMVHGESADLLYHILLPQQVGFDRHRHV